MSVGRGRFGYLSVRPLPLDAASQSALDMRRLISSLLLLAIAGLTFSCSKPPLPDYGLVPQFTLTDSNGQPFDSQSLHGKVWLADFIYTNCPGPCPRMTSQMHQIEQNVNSF